MKQTPLERALTHIRITHLAKLLDVTYPSIYRWLEQGRLPLTELSGETRYAAIIEDATGGEVTQQELIEWSFPDRLREISND